MIAPRIHNQILRVKNLSVDYILDDGEFRAVKDVSFELKRGEIFGLAGESGCGKSTIAFAISRLLEPPAYISDGSIHLNGENLLKMDQEELKKLRWSKVSMVFQSAMHSLNPVMRVADQFADMLKKHSVMSKAECVKRAQYLLGLVGIDEARVFDYPHQFSGGMRQRIVIAIGLALNPDLVIMDEPTTALDVVVQYEILHAIHALQKEFGFAILFITHDLSLMAQFCDKIAIMLKGEIIEMASAWEIMHFPTHEYTKRLWQSIPSIFENEQSFDFLQEEALIDE